MANRRRRRVSNSVLRDTSFIANRLSWEGCVILGVVGFTLFYFFIPMWIHHQLEALQGNMFKPMVEAVLGRRIHWVQWLGIAIGLICSFFAIRNYFELNPMGQYGEKNVSLFSKILARLLD